jgi:hypothetical protein
MGMLARAVVSRIARGSALALILAAGALAQEAFALAQEAVGQVAVASPLAQLGLPPPSPEPLPAPAVHHPQSDELDDSVDEAGHGFGDTGPAFRDYVRLNAGPLSIEPVVLMQVQGIPYVGADATVEAGDPSDRAGFRFRLARFGFDGRIFHRIPFEITAEFNSDVAGTALLHDAWFGYDRYRFLQVVVGTHDVPFSRAALIGAGDSALIERPFAVRAMAPFHQLGASIQGHFWSGALNYYAGVYNGLQRNDYFFEGYVENSAILGNMFDGLTYAGRITSEPLGSPGRSIEDLHRGKLRIAAGASGFYSDGGTRGILGLGGDFLLHYRGLHVMAEFIANRTVPKMQPTQPTDQTATVTSYAAYAEAGYMLMRDRLGITGRFEWLDPNTAVKDESNSWIFTGGLSYHVLNDFLKAQLNYTHREELYGLPLKNDSVVVQIQLNL